MKIKECVNCGATPNHRELATVSVSCPCPVCIGNGELEIDVLRVLARYIENNVAGRSRPPKALVKILERLKLSRGEKAL